jgi:hypothetical protein
MRAKLLFGVWPKYRPVLRLHTTTLPNGVKVNTGDNRRKQRLSNSFWDTSPPSAYFERPRDAYTITPSIAERAQNSR